MKNQAWFKSGTWHLYNFSREIVVTARISLTKTVTFADFAAENCKDEFGQNEPCQKSGKDFDNESL